MKPLLFLLFLFISIYQITLSQEITRGPEIGEIYFTGPTVTVLYDAIYRSTDFGQTAVCVDSVTALSTIISAIAADKAPGGIYYSDIYEQLFYSPNNGVYGSWELKNQGIYSYLNSGVIQGYIFEGSASHSENFGITFINHNGYGGFGSYIESEIDTSHYGYLITYQENVIDTLYLFLTTNDFDNLNLICKLNFFWFDFIDLSRECNLGALYLFNNNKNRLFFSNDFGANWMLINTFTCPNLPIKGITGGRQNGELYMLVEYLQLAGQRLHLYIYHSLDYGETFTVYHPVSIGPDPIYANFITEDTLTAPNAEVHFTDLSNDAEIWQWDFENDGIIDSYEQNPVHVYPDTGYYSVKLTIIAEEIVEDHATRYNYIHVSNTIGLQSHPRQRQLNVFPNPASGMLNISLSDLPESNRGAYNISLINSLGEVKIQDLFYPDRHTVTWQINIRDYPPGFYYVRVKAVDECYIKKVVVLE